MEELPPEDLAAIQAKATDLLGGEGESPELLAAVDEAVADGEEGTISLEEFRIEMEQWARSK